MKYKAVRKLILGLSSFILSLVVCYMIWPASNGTVHALSDYGTVLPTLLPYTAGFLISMVLILQAGRELPQTTDINRKLSKIFKALSVVLLILLATPYTWNPVFFIIHMTTGSILFLSELAAGVWLAQMLRPRKLNLLIVTLQFAGGLMLFAGLKQVGIIPEQYVALGQLLALGMFSILLVRAVLQIERMHLSELSD
jgi:hypothetical protein